MNIDEHIAGAAAVLTRAQYAIALVGAGISVESGIPPFRGPGGLWTKRGEPPMDGYERFLTDPGAYWRGRAAQRESDDEFVQALRAARANPAHIALARLETLGVLKHTISQNIDNLHFEAGSVEVTEIHGNRTKVRCIDCGARWPWEEYEQIVTSANNAGDGGRMGASSSGHRACPQCTGIVKGDTVMFGEPIPQHALAECHAQADRADCVLIAGTSATVYPAAYFPERVLARGGTLIEVNPDETPFTRHARTVLRGPAGELLPALVEQVEKRLRSSRAAP